MRSDNAADHRELYAAGVKIGDHVVNFRGENISPKMLQALAGDLLPQYAHLQGVLRTIVVQPSFLRLLDFAGTGKGTAQRDALLGDLKDVYSEKTILAIRLIIDGLLHVDYCAKKYIDQSSDQEEAMRLKPRGWRLAIVRWILFIPVLFLSWRLIELLLRAVLMEFASRLRQDMGGNLAYYNFFTGALTAIAISVIISALAPASKRFSAIIACSVMILLIAKDYLMLSVFEECGRAPEDPLDWHFATAGYSHIIIPYPTCSGAIFLGIGILVGCLIVFLFKNPRFKIALFMPGGRPRD